LILFIEHIKSFHVFKPFNKTFYFFLILLLNLLCHPFLT
jgi:hypothetical protein